MAYLRAFGCYLPARVAGNAEMAATLGTAAAWILQSSGIEERRYAEPQQTVAELGTLAARDCIEASGIGARDIGLLIVASGSAERRFPGPASSIGAALGIQGTPAIDLPIASAGSLFGIALAARLAESYQNVLVIGSEIMSRVMDMTPAGQDSAVLFGDGAGACLVSAHTGFSEIVDCVLASDGDAAEALQLPLDGPLEMDGRTIILHASRKVPRAIGELLERNGRKPEDVGTYLLHQANWNLITRVARSLGVAESKFYCNLKRYGNTSSASLLIAACEWWREQGGVPDSPIVLAAFGAGLHWGAVLAR